MSILKIFQVIHTTPDPIFENVSSGLKPAPVAMAGSADQAGPFGYVDKGTFFTDEHVTDFPERIEVIYQVIDLCNYQGNVQIGL